MAAPGIVIQVDPSQPGRVARLFERLRGRSNLIAQRRLAQLASLLKGYVQVSAPRKTGSLAQSIRIQGSGWRYEIVSDLPRAVLVHEGTAPHPIDPRRPAYALWWEGLPHPIPRVPRHPGAQAQPFLDWALRDARRDGVLDRAAAQIAGDLAVYVERR